MIEGYIYGLIDPRTTEIRYVGRTIASLAFRLMHHIAETQRFQTNAWKTSHKHNWIINLARDGLKPEINLLKTVYSATEELTELISEEENTIAEYKKGGRLTNTMDGGCGWTSQQLKDLWATPEWREKQQQIMRNVYKTDDYKVKLIMGRKKLWENESYRTTMLTTLKAEYEKPEVREHRLARLREARKSDSSRLNTSEASKKSWVETREKRIASIKVACSTPEGKQTRLRCINKAVQANKRKIRCLETGHKFESATEAAKQMKLNRKAINNQLCGRAKSTAGFHFSYYD